MCLLQLEFVFTAQIIRHLHFFVLIVRVRDGMQLLLAFDSARKFLLIRGKSDGARNIPNRRQVAIVISSDAIVHSEAPQATLQLFITLSIVFFALLAELLPSSVQLELRLGVVSSLFRCH